MTVTPRCSWNPATRRPFTDERWLTRACRLPLSIHIWVSFFCHQCSLNVTSPLPFGLRQDYLSSSSDLQEVLQLDPNVQEAEQELEVVTALLRQSLMENAA